MSLLGFDADEMRNRTHPVREHIGVQRVQWKLERAGGWILLGIMVLTLLGVFSRGPLSSATAVSPNGNLTVEYERFLRNGATFTMVISVRGNPGEMQRIDLSGEMLEGTTIESIQPSPDQVSTHRRTGFSLDIRPDAEGYARVHLSLRADGVGRYRSQVSNGSSKVDLAQFIYP
ncbi:hypothetical protein [Pseudomonas paralcaligenes]|uniref:hypothetical protein n=1 Tax=Pseudomonas paralcaligenes TaxID=2772558 RepID=UPI001C7FE3E5|nr:hypothetical protein [Pseudomonas paralcaligenes]